MSVFRDRRDAGRQLARQLGGYAGRPDVVVLGLARGGVPVACEVARALHVRLDVCVVRKLGVPGQEELAFGALASPGVLVIDDEVAGALALPIVDEIVAREQQELERRERTYRDGQSPVDVTGMSALLIDDGLATGSSMRAAIRSLRRRDAAAAVVAVPVAPRQTCAALMQEADDLVCLLTPEPFRAVGFSYERFGQTTDDEVCELLHTCLEDT